MKPVATKEDDKYLKHADEIGSVLFEIKIKLFLSL